MYPCPECREPRPGLHAACVHCDWRPHEDEPKPPEPKVMMPPYKKGKSLIRSNKAWLLIALGGCLSVAASGPLLIFGLFEDGWSYFRILGLVQLAFGILFLGMGLMAKRKPQT